MCLLLLWYSFVHLIPSLIIFYFLLLYLVLLYSVLQDKWFRHEQWGPMSKHLEYIFSRTDPTQVDVQGVLAVRTSINVSWPLCCRRHVVIIVFWSVRADYWVMITGSWLLGHDYWVVFTGQTDTFPSTIFSYRPVCVFGSLSFSFCLFLFSPCPFIDCSSQSPVASWNRVLSMHLCD